MSPDPAVREKLLEAPNRPSAVSFAVPLLMPQVIELVPDPNVPDAVTLVLALRLTP